MKISAIVPVYNSENYVGRCIESVLSQTYQDWELILVDDGSIDKSLKILKDYEKKDCRIKVIHQENKGPGIARNTGIKQALGEYIVFIDSDDVITKDYFELLSQKTEDVVFIDINQVDEEFNILKEEHMSKYCSFSKEKILRQQMTGKINWGGVRKAVKRKLLYDNNILYSEHKIGEEAIYSFLILFYAKSISFLKSPTYFYVNRLGSQSDIKMNDPWGKVAMSLKKKILEINEYENYANTLNAFIFTAAVISLDKIANNYNYEEYKKLGKERFKKYLIDYDRNFSIDLRNINNKALVVYPLLYLNFINIIYFISWIKRKIKIFIK